MTVKELKEYLASLPDDAEVYRQGDEYNGDYRSVTKIEYHPIAGWGIPYNSVFLR